MDFTSVDFMSGKNHWWMRREVYAMQSAEKCAGRGQVKLSTVCRPPMYLFCQLSGDYRGLWLRTCSLSVAALASTIFRSRTGGG